MKSAICLSNIPQYDWRSHFQNLLRQGAIEDLCIDGSRVRVCLSNGRRADLIVLPKERKIDVALSGVQGSTCDVVSLFKEVVFAIKPLWACCYATFSTMRPLHTSLSHICSIPHIAQYSYWNESYAKLFSNKLMSLERLGLCDVKRLGNDVWIEVRSSSEEEHLAKASDIEKILTNIDIWDGGNGRSEAVQMALLKQCSIDEGLRDLSLWRQEHKCDAIKSYTKSLEAARLAVVDFGRKSCDGCVCSIISRAEDGVAWFWVKGSRLDALARSRDRILVGRVTWGVVLHGLKKTQKEIVATMEILNSCAEVVKCENLRVLY